MRKNLWILGLALGASAMVWQVQATADSNASVVFDGIQQSQVGRFPSGWKTYPFQKNKAHQIYKVVEENGAKYIQAVDHKDLSVPIFKDVFWDTQKYPYLKFKWRARLLPKGARESSPETNDSACGLYVGWSRSHALKYVWSSSLSPGTYWAKNPGKFVVVVLNSGEKSLGQWQEVSLKIPEEHQKYFQKPMEGSPEGIGLLTDGNATHQPAECDYADFRISSAP